MYIIGREVDRHFKGMSISKKPKEWRQKPQHGPDPTSLILPLWRSPAGKTCQYSKCVFIYSWSQEPQGCSYQAGFSQSLGRTTGAPAWRAVPHHTLSPLCVGPESGSERRQTGHGTHTASIRPGHPRTQHLTTSRGMPGRDSRQHTTAFTQQNCFSSGLGIGTHVLFI